MELGVTWPVAGWTLLFTFVGLLSMVALVRVYGLRSFAKFTGFDFATTIALGSVLATIATGSLPLAKGLIALGGLFLAQRVLLYARNNGLSSLIDNEPILLMRGDEVLWENLSSGGVTASDLRGKLREANVLDTSQVRAVVLEATGDISVLHGEADGPELDRAMLADVKGIDDDASDWPPTWWDGPGLGDPGQ